MAVTKYKKAVKFATTKSVENQIREWESSDETAGVVVACRSRFHSWEDYTAARTPQVSLEVQKCLRCGGYRHRYLSATTGKIRRGWRTDLPPGYAVPRGMGRIARHAMWPIHLAATKSLASKRVATEADLHAELRALITGEEE